MTTATILISGFTILVSGTYYPQFGDGFNDPIEPAGWEITELLLNGAKCEIEYLTFLLKITELDLHNALSEQEQSDYEYNFI